MVRESIDFKLNDECPEGAKFEALGAPETYRNFGGRSKRGEVQGRTSGEKWKATVSSGELPERTPCPTPAHSPF